MVFLSSSISNGFESLCDTFGRLILQLPAINDSPVRSMTLMDLFCDSF